MRRRARPSGPNFAGRPQAPRTGRSSRTARPRRLGPDPATVGLDSRGPAAVQPRPAVCRSFDGPSWVLSAGLGGWGRRYRRQLLRIPRVPAVYRETGLHARPGTGRLTPDPTRRVVRTRPAGAALGGSWTLG